MISYLYNTKYFSFPCCRSCSTVSCSPDLLLLPLLLPLHARNFYLGIADDRRVQPHDVIPVLHDVPPPSVLDVFLQLHPEGTVVEEAREPVVNLAERGEGEDLKSQRIICSTAETRQRSAWKS